ncbi:hypothetical protein GMAR_ORF240 [Golden Marseillevirus]|uniref:hypothetical protein n=1 Tax=Golden Marseillevirus TaxID=1720526 RepID=UPI000877AC2A|nr:hypothetical protein GMAR_ORF240 [Golden Marseillevirus]ALX27614.1 hypothetical protein GMAR_ORF240 [Golden Marseillevirus]
MTFQGGPKITNHGNIYELNWGLGCPTRYVGSAYLGRSFQPFSGGGGMPQYEYRKNLTRPWLPPSLVQIKTGEIDNIYACSTVAGPINPWDNLAPDRAPCKRPENDGLGSTDWKRWC